jgi:type I restriction-modification system DNA methylase subunit
MESKTIQYSDLSIKLTKDLDKNDKKEHGIYFTPPSTVHKNLNRLLDFMPHIQSVLEPSCGSCEYVTALHSLYPHLSITAIENNTTIYDSIKHLTNKSIQIICSDFLSMPETNLYDLIIGNPPYVVMKKPDVNKKYHKYFDGRPNIFILFIIQSLKLLKDNGILSFVLPQSFLNCLYYNKTRQFIHKHCQIIDIIECDDDYIETKQETILLIVQKKEAFDLQLNKDFILEINDYLIFGSKSNIEYLELLYENSTTLSELGFEVNVGTVVWNQCKHILTNDSTKTRLIYSSDIVNKELTMKTYSNAVKKNYIDKPGDFGPLLVVNRGYGVGNYNFEYCLINDESMEYLIENHLICIRHVDPIEKKELLTLYNKIIASLSNEQTNKFIELYFGNNAINTTELNYLLPIYL